MGTIVKRVHFPRWVNGFGGVLTIARPRKHIHPRTRARHLASALPARGFYGKKADTREKNPFSDAQLPDPFRSGAL